ncbi:hypothetical protein ABZY81_39650 [Streptomyces sp. NPDC006514]|uniref:hypothetical protein n=1 Tax=Streptomyces sp. NPDC006514 TaxID=3154308 RepID=UPI0033BD3F8D
MNSRPSGFEDRLKAALLARLPEAVPAPPARSFARRYGIPLAVGVATATVVAVMTLTGSSHTGSLPAGTPSRSASDAPKITKEPDGSLRFDPPRQEQLPALADRLKELGVPTVVPPLLPELECKAVKGWVRSPKDDPAAGVSHGDDGRTLKVNPKAVPPGHTLVLTWAYFQPWWEEKQGLAFGVLPNEWVPYCSVDFREAYLKEKEMGRPTRTPSLPGTTTSSP